MSFKNTPSAVTEATRARPYPSRRLNARERKVLATEGNRVFGGKHTTNSATTTDAFTITGLTANDIVTASIQSSVPGSTIVSVTPSANTLTVVYSIAPSTTTVLAYHVIKAS